MNENWLCIKFRADNQAGQLSIESLGRQSKMTEDREDFLEPTICDSCPVIASIYGNYDNGKMTSVVVETTEPCPQGN